MSEKFCYPLGLRLLTEQHSPQFFSNVMTDSEGERIYLFIVLFCEPPTHQILEKLENTFHLTRENLGTFYIQQCMCLISRYPYHSLFKEYMSELYRIVTRSKEHIGAQTPWPSLGERPSLAAELLSHLVNIVFECPAPPPGISCVRICVGEKILHYSLPAPNDLPLLDVDMRLLFFSLSPSHIVSIISALLLEQKVLLLSARPALLTIACETLLALAYPFPWLHTYIPLLPTFLADYVQTPTPFLIGTHPSAVRASLVARDVLLVDLDKDTLILPRSPPNAKKKKSADDDDEDNDAFPLVPKHIREKLMTQIVCFCFE